ncbi:MAG: alpha-2-macroglobulin [Pseudomonadota bacterium]
MLRVFMLLPLLVVAQFFSLSTPAITAEAAAKSYRNDVVARDAERYLTFIRQRPAPTGRTFKAVRRDARKAISLGQPRVAVDRYADAVTLDPQNASAWLGLAQSLEAIKKPASNQERFNLRVNAGAAAYRAYQLTKRPGLEARALALVARSLRARSFWRPALVAFRASLAIEEQPTVRAAYASLRAEKGFRIVNYTVSSDASRPRVCVQFSETLAKRREGFADFFSVDGREPASVRVEGRQACLEGFSHGERYRITVRRELPSVVDEQLLKTATLTVYVRDRSPSVRFNGRNYVLPRVGQQGIPVTTVNTTSVALSIFRIGDRSIARTVLDGRFNAQLSQYDQRELATKLGAPVWNGSLAVAKDLNKEVTTAFNVGEAIPRIAPGVYAMSARADGAKAERWATQATQWFVVSDLGMTALKGRDGIHAMVRSLETAMPVKGATIDLIARNNEKLGSSTTDEAGRTTFPAGLIRGEGGMAPALLVARNGDADYVFLNLATSAFDLTDRGVSGREIGGPVEAFVFTERGVYRPGGTVHLTALLRDERANAVRDVPTTLVILRPDGAEHRRLVLDDRGHGARLHDLTLSPSSMTGTWRVRFYTDPKSDPIGTTSFLVEDFVPERLALTVTPPAEALDPQREHQLAVAGRYLYGPPAADLALEADVTVRPRAGGRAGWPGFTFGLDDEQVTPIRRALANLPRTNDAGRAAIDLRIPALPQTSRPLEARVSVRMRERGGRVIERAATMPLAATSDAIGINALFKGEELAPDATAGFELAHVAQDGTARANATLAWTLYRLERTYQWYNRNGNWRYEATDFTRKIAAGEATTDASGRARISTPVSWGRYRLEVTGNAIDAPLLASSRSFTAGWYADDTSETPERLEIALDRKGYKPGDEARVTITAEDRGRVLLTVLGNRKLFSREVSVEPGTTTLTLTVAEDWAPGAYVSAFFFRPMDVGLKRMPRRAIGVAWLDIDRTARTLAVETTVPKTLRSGEKLSVPVRIDGLAEGEKANLVMAAVDVGILNLTRFKTPAPDDHFYAQRRLGVEIRDIYGRLIDGMRATRGAIRSGGDGGAQMLGAPPTGDPVALFSGLVTTDAEGRAVVSFDVPEFTGTLKIMTAAWTGTRLGHAERTTVVRDPIVLQVSSPRFLTAGDRSRILVDMHNVDAPAGPVTLTVRREPDAGAGEATTAVPYRTTLDLNRSQRRRVDVPLTASTPGFATYAIALEQEGKKIIDRRISFRVKSRGGAVNRRSVVQLAPGASLALGSDLIAGLRPGTAGVRVLAGRQAAFNVPGLMRALADYPYACAEQTTSRALPLLYLSSLTGPTSGVARAEVEKRVASAITRLRELQSSNGGFGLWQAGRTDIWLTAYVTDFLSRAKEQNFAVPDRVMTQALDRLANHVTYAGDFKNGGEALAYALYVLARSARASVGDLRYYADTHVERFATPLALGQLGAALALYGDNARATELFTKAVARLSRPADDRWRVDYGTRLRDVAGVYTLINEVRAPHPLESDLEGLIGEAFAARQFTSTQESAWMLLAAQSSQLSEEGTRVAIDGTITPGPLDRRLAGTTLVGAGHRLVNRGSRTIPVAVTVTGDAIAPEPQDARGLAIKRRYFSLGGKPIDLASAEGGRATLAQNARMVVVLELSEAVPLGGRFLLVDHLPAGLEVENPRLANSGDTTTMKWLSRANRPVHVDFRKDRVVAAFDAPLQNGKATKRTFTAAYIVRAVSPGAFQHPSATVEDMYRPERYARTAAGQLTIEPVR